MQYAMGFDGGGTKTECVVLDAYGKVVGEGRAGPSNPLRVSYETAYQSLRDASAQALQNANLKKHRVAAVCAGVAGAGRRSVMRKMLVFLGQEFPEATVNAKTDAEIALEAGAGTSPGIVLIAGTGSMAYGRNAAGETARAGGYGPWIGDEGSAFDIGRRAVAAVARTRDFSGPVTVLSEMIPEVLKCLDWDELLERIMRDPDQVFPKVFPLVIDAAGDGDSTAKEILFTAAIGLGNLAMIVVRRLGMEKEEFPLLKTGGVMGRSPVLENLLDSVLVSGVPRARVSALPISPAIGAARMASRFAELSTQAASHG